MLFSQAIRRAWLRVGILLSFLLLCSQVMAEPRLQVYFLNDFPPYYYVDTDNRPAGLIVEAAQRVLEHSGVAYELRPLNLKRIINAVKNEANVAAIGFFRTPERLRWSIMSAEIYRPPAPVFVVEQAALERFPQPSGFAAVERALIDGHVEGVLIDGYSYGIWADARIQRHFPTLKRQVMSMEQALRIVASPVRADFTLAYPDQAKHLIDTDSSLQGRLRFRQIDGAPKLNNGSYWMISRATSPEIIARIEQSNRAVRDSDFYRELVRRYTEL